MTLGRGGGEEHERMRDDNKGPLCPGGPLSISLLTTHAREDAKGFLQHGRGRPRLALLLQGHRVGVERRGRLGMLGAAANAPDADRARKAALGLVVLLALAQRLAQVEQGRGNLERVFAVGLAAGGDEGVAQGDGLGQEGLRAQLARELRRGNQHALVRGPARVEGALRAGQQHRGVDGQRQLRNGVERVAHQRLDAGGGGWVLVLRLLLRC